MCKEKEMTEAAYRYYVDEACIEDIAKQLHRSYNYTRLIIKKYRGAFRDAIIMHWLEQEKKLQAVADEYFNDDDHGTNQRNFSRIRRHSSKSCSETKAAVRRETGIYTGRIGNGKDVSF